MLLLLLPLPASELALGQGSVARHSEILSITEPGIYRVEDLYKRADIVAVVQIVSGDTENYETAVYKAQVLKGFKGAATGQTLYFGPFVGDRLGSEYFVFLLDVKAPISPKSTAGLNYGIVHYEKIFDEGYSSMETSYKCGFDGKDIAQSCDYGVRVCTDYIVLPKSIATSPPMSDDPPFGCRWVRKSDFDSLLDRFASRPAARH
jgi:hypothetical protein